MSSDEQDTLQRHLVDFIYQDVFNVIKPEDFLQIVSTNVWMHEGRQLQPDEVVSLRQDAQMLRNSKLWVMLLNELRYKAQEKMYNQSRTPQDLVAGKLMLYIINILEERMNKM